MSFWLFRASVLWVAGLAAALSACVPVEGPPGQALPRTASFLAGEMRVSAPPGYCIDRSASHETQTGAVVLMGRCTDADTVAPALITLSAGPVGSAQVLKSGGPALSAWFTSGPGRAALARDGRAGSVRVLKTGLSGGVFVMRVADRQAGDYWRAILGLKGRLVSISVTGTKGATLPEAAGRSLLDRAVAGFVAANGG
ncbi:cation transport ATPase [Xinfangfangia pollutisoli]|uniref:cation transport ATPase n=1 Tax=Xinfangfangia pollutisoli TaxID=2865960 RepID=UPI001CD55DAA|nr:cation transport ATPase [Xinfangfangia pollutisoli]